MEHIKFLKKDKNCEWCTRKEEEEDDEEEKEDEEEEEGSRYGILYGSTQLYLGRTKLTFKA
jgi:hypothetical protein